MSDKTHICINCGAQINTSDTKCPYCGYINEEGAEKAYIDHLYDIRDNLDSVDEKAATEYGRGYGKVLKLILITLAVLLVISGIVYAIRLTEKSKRKVTDQSRGSDMLNEMTWKKPMLSSTACMTRENMMKCVRLYMKPTNSITAHMNGNITRSLLLMMIIL